MQKENKTKEAGDFVNVVRDIVRQELSTHDSTVVAMVESINADGSLNLYVLPDMNNVVHNVTNQCRYSFNPGDTATLFLINGKVNNAFVVAKHDPKNDFLFRLENELENDEDNNQDTVVKNAVSISSGSLQLSTSWTQENDEYYQDVMVSDVSADDSLFIAPKTRADQIALDQANIFCTLSSGSVRFYALEEPTATIDIDYTIISN